MLSKVTNLDEVLNHVFNCKMCQNYVCCMEYNDLRQFYTDNFGLGNLNGSKNRSSFENRLVLISLICYITSKAKLKNPDTTYYNVVQSLAKGFDLPDKFLRGLSIICEDFSYQSSEFPTFGLKGQDIIKEAKSILKGYMPF